MIFFSSFSAFPNLYWLEKLPTYFLSYSAFPNLFSLFLGLPQHILPRKAAIIVFSIFLEFSITGRVGTPRNDFFFFNFLSFSAIPNLFWPEKLPKCWFLIFLIFLPFYFNFLLRVGYELIGMIFFFSYFLFLSAFPNLFWLRKKPQ